MDASRSAQSDPIPATTVGIRELRHDFRAWLERARSGERIIVTDRGRRVVELGPYREERTMLQQMYDDGQVVRAKRRPRAAWKPTDPITTTLSDELQRMRDEDQR